MESLVDKGLVAKLTAGLNPAAQGQTKSVFREVSLEDMHPAVRTQAIEGMARRAEKRDSAMGEGLSRLRAANGISAPAAGTELGSLPKPNVPDARTTSTQRSV